VIPNSKDEDEWGGGGVTKNGEICIAAARRQ